MNDRTDLSYFNLIGIDKSLGYEVSRTAPVDNIVTIHFAIPPKTDLIISHSLEFKLFVHLRYHLDGDIAAFTSDTRAQKYFRAANLGANEERGIRLILPGMERAKYPFAVWLHYIRSLLLVPRDTEWGTATMLRSEFKHVSADWPTFIPHPAQELRLLHGAGRTRGKRNYMEDVDFVFESISISNKRTVSVFGVMDGHGGKECAQYCSEDIPMRIAALLRKGTTCPDALYRAFRESDTECLETHACGNAGSTANVAMYDASTNVFYIANTGDTRAVLSRGGKALDLSYDRKGTDPEEMARVARAGGFVVKGRIMGSLAVSRALGDLQLKEQGAQGLQRVLIPDPELSCFYPTRQDDFMLIATDGLWDVMNSQAAVDFAQNLLTQEGLLGSSMVEGLSAEVVSERLAQVAHNMATHAVSNLGSNDNVTVLIVLLRGGPDRSPIDTSAPPSGRSTPALVQGSGGGSGFDDDLGDVLWGGVGSGATSSSGTVSSTRYPQGIASTKEYRDDEEPLQRYCTAASERKSEVPPVKPVSTKPTVASASPSLDLDDDLMDFLNDDSNF